MNIVLSWVQTYILSSTGAGVWRKAPMAFPDSSYVLDEVQLCERMVRKQETPRTQTSTVSNSSKDWGFGRAVIPGSEAGHSRWIWVLLFLACIKQPREPAGEGFWGSFATSRLCLSPNLVISPNISPLTPSLSSSPKTLLSCHPAISPLSCTTTSLLFPSTSLLSPNHLYPIAPAPVSSYHPPFTTSPLLSSSQPSPHTSPVPSPHLSSFTSLFLLVSLSISYISISLYLYISISLYPLYLYISISLYLYISISLYLYISISLYLYISISLYLYISISLYLYISISLYLYISISLYLYISISLYLYISISLYLYISISLYLYLYIYIYICMYIPLSLLSQRSWVARPLQKVRKKTLSELVP